jgi:hypothetical protein
LGENILLTFCLRFKDFLEANFLFTTWSLGVYLLSISALNLIVNGLYQLCQYSRQSLPIVLKIKDLAMPSGQISLERLERKKKDKLCLYYFWGMSTWPLVFLLPFVLFNAFSIREKLTCQRPYCVSMFLLFISRFLY